MVDNYFFLSNDEKVALRDRQEEIRREGLSYKPTYYKSLNPHLIGLIALIVVIIIMIIKSLPK